MHLAVARPVEIIWRATVFDCMVASMIDADTDYDRCHRALIMVSRFAKVHRETPGVKGTDTGQRLEYFTEQARLFGATDTQIAAARA